MLIWGSNTDFLIGPATITVDTIEIGPTLKETDVKLTIEPITQEIKTDESSEIKEVIQTGEELEVTFAIPYTSDSASFLGLLGNSMVLQKTGELVIDSNSLLITVYKAAMTFEVSKSYAWDKSNKINVKVKGLRNSEGNLYNIELKE